MPTDRLFKTNRKIKGSFAFNAKTAHVFDDMVTRSVPFYSEIQRMIVEIAASFIRSNTNVYDIGCSTGTTLLNLAKHIHKKKIRLVGIDFSEAMLEKAMAKLQKNGILNQCGLINEDLNRDFEIKNSSVVIMNLTLQFVKPAKRRFVVSKIYKGLKRGGCLIFVEKILLNETKLDRKFTEFYYNFKIRNNYSKLEISQKREALESVLIPCTYDENMKLLEKSGFKLIDTFFRWYNFCGMIAVKS